MRLHCPLYTHSTHTAHTHNSRLNGVSRGWGVQGFWSVSSWSVWVCCSAHTCEVDGHSSSIAPSVGGILWCIVVFLFSWTWWIFIWLSYPFFSPMHFHFDLTLNQYLLIGLWLFCRLFFFLHLLPFCQFQFMVLFSWVACRAIRVRRLDCSPKGRC